MNVSNAFGFVGLGLVMETLPSWAPDVVATRGLDGASTRELWLLFMGGVLIAIGAGYLARVAWAKRPRIVWPEPVREAVREVFRPASAGETRAPARAGRGTRMAA